MNDINAQTIELTDQLNKLEDPTLTDEKYIKELEIYHALLTKADLSVESQAASKKRELTMSDKVLAPVINKLAKKINKTAYKINKRNKK